MAKITKFYFQKAVYLVGDDRHDVLLELDYKNNDYKIIFEKESEKSLKSQLTRIAKDLLQRKHGINFAHKFS